MVKIQFQNLLQEKEKKIQKINDKLINCELKILNKILKIEKK